VIDTSQIYRRKPTPEENNALRELFDGDDQFWEGMQVVRPRTLQVKHRKEEDTAPFLYNDRGTVDFLRRCFPGLPENRDHLHQAKFWYAVIHYYFRMGMTNRAIQQERGFIFERSRIDYTVQQIRRKIKGLRRNGKAYSTRPRGRPRKQV